MRLLLQQPNIDLNKSKLISQYRNDKKTGLTNLFQKIPKPQLRIVITDEQMVDKLIYIGIDNNINWRQHYLIKFNSNEEQEKSVVIKTIKGLLNECEIAKTKYM